MFSTNSLLINTHLYVYLYFFDCAAFCVTVAVTCCCACTQMVGQSQPVPLVSLIHCVYLEAEQIEPFQQYLFDKSKAELSKPKFLSKYVFDSPFFLGSSLISQQFPITEKLKASL